MTSLENETKTATADGTITANSISYTYKKTT